MDITQIIAYNLSAWMEANPNLNTLQKLSKASHVGFGTIQRAKNGDGSITVQNLHAIGRAFKRQAIDLLQLPATEILTEATTPNSITMALNGDEQNLLAGYRQASPEVQQIMLNAALSSLLNQTPLRANRK